MLVLTRNINEIIFVGNEVKLIVLGVKGCPVRIGIEAPKNILILREELYLSQEQAEKEVDTR